MADELAIEVITTIKRRVESEQGGIAAASMTEITIETELTSLGIDSLGLADVLWDLEQAHGIKIELNTSDAWSNLSNVGDVVEAVRGLIAKEV
ncbi:acyl carrier protein [Neorhizobium galegae]|uniref:NodF n=2 Tax=Neorhizobium galegae bv. officinalis TaxID=323656 RepID=A0A0T7G086_NEOGA|nr:acyl carrier protein [Neorhizobium galegae]KAA9382446.1 acyl carrier protein [Neorhizobium galegae]KAB1110068.1 acyl carrier protein [Neorhizobium galegae]MCM2497553.1 acyl carrier protein [Neorhizobium galegae]MCQ1769584.1 acyl carrier protein [Neorhizobium galegae]MCQ1775176.1 acyl carrier protein [Neorhizobium galegae]